jgi:diphthamide biosynthesis methyltransferase
VYTGRDGDHNKVIFCEAVNSSDCHCCHRYCNINNNDYTTESRQQAGRLESVVYVNFFVSPSIMYTTLLKERQRNLHTLLFILQYR